MKSIHRLLSFATASAAMFLLCNCHTTGSTGPTGPACCTPGATKCPPGCTKPCCAKKCPPGCTKPCCAKKY